MSTAVIGVATYVAIGPTMLALAIGAVALGAISFNAGVLIEKRQSERVEEHKKFLLGLVDKVGSEIEAEAEMLKDVNEREYFINELKNSADAVKDDIENSKKTSPEKTLYKIREKIRAALIDEETASAAKESLENLTEDKFIAPKGKIALLVSEISDFVSRIMFFGEEEYRKLSPLTEEAMTCRDEFRLSLIRDEVKMTYGKLKEQKVLTEMFKEEIRDMLPLVKRARGAESIIVRMEELLTAHEIPREEFMPLYEDTKIIIAEQLENITNEAVAEKVGSVLNDMGYSLVGDELNNFSAGEVNIIDSPYEGYQVKVKVDKGGMLSTRLIRVVGSESEKESASEYQKQKDVEVGKKWCKDLDAFHTKMKSEGIEFKTMLRKDPGEELLDVVVDVKKQQRRSRDRVVINERKHV